MDDAGVATTKNVVKGNVAAKVFNQLRHPASPETNCAANVVKLFVRPTITFETVSRVAVKPTSLVRRAAHALGALIRLQQKQIIRDIATEPARDVLVKFD